MQSKGMLQFTGLIFILTLKRIIYADNLQIANCTSYIAHGISHIANPTSYITPDGYVDGGNVRPGVSPRRTPGIHETFFFTFTF